MIKLNCPACNEQLEVDVGFAGGICRCFECGTLMTVPAKTGGRAEQLQRTKRPARPARPGEPAPEETQTYVTSTGKQLDVSAEQLRKVVVANKARMGIRAGVILIFIAVFGLLGGAIVLISINLLHEAEQNQQHQPEPGNGGPIVIPADPTGGNPLLAQKPGVLGLQISGTGTTEIVIDTSIAMERYMPFISAGLPRGIGSLPGETAVQVIYAGESGPTAQPESPTPISQWDVTGFASELQTLDGRGGQNLLAAIQAALAATPDRIIMIFSDKPVRFEWEKIEAALTDTNATIHLIKLGRDVDDLKEFTKRFGGEYHNLPDGQIDVWLDEWREKNQ